MNKLRQISKLFSLVMTMCLLMSSTSYASEQSYSSESESVELESGYYEDVTIDGSAIYAKGFADGKAHATFTETFDTIVVDPSSFGVFTSDGTSEAKTYSGELTAGIDLGVTAASGYTDYLSFSGWDIDVGNKTLTLTAKFESPSSYSYTGAVQKWLCTESGTYKLTVAGAGNGTTQYGGGLMIGTMYIEEGTLLYVYVGGSGSNGYGTQSGGFNGGGSGYGCSSSDVASGGAGATDIRVSSTALSARVIVGGGGGGKAAYGNGGSSYGGYTSGGTAHHKMGSEPYTSDGQNHGGSVYAYPGTQTSGYSLGTGQSASSRSSSSYGSAWGGGGGGYYGGYAYTGSGESSACAGGGGSSYYKSGTVTLVSYVNGYQSSTGMAKIEKVE